MRWFAENRPYVARLIERWQDTWKKGARKDVMLLGKARDRAAMRSLAL